MRTSFSFLGLAITILTFSACVSTQTIRGNGELVTEAISITDYDKIQTAGSIKVDYIQSEEAPFFEVTTDANIFEKYEFTVSNNNTLMIKPKKEFRRGYNFRPTQFSVITNSSGLSKIELAGNSQFHANNTIHTDNLKASVAGSGTVHFHETLTVEDMHADIAGSGTFIAEDIHCVNIKGEIAGSGTLKLTGNGQKATFSIAGSGDVRTFDFVVDEMKCDIAGSGDIEITVNKSINASIAGSGRIKYKGDATDIKRSVAGSGSIKKIED